VKTDPRTAFFDAVADKWDGWQDLPKQEKALADALEAFGVRPDETIADIGCGTGTLTRVLLRRLGAAGRVVAVDFSQAMLDRARAKTADPRVAWLRAPADGLAAVADGACDRVICYSAWPHFADPAAVVREFRRILKPGGAAHILHLISRDQVNHIHRHASNPAIHRDTLPPANELAALFTSLGFTVTDVRDDDAGFLVTAAKNG
jgi:ubiquinone/menaquinone biosynthesis C-methylase UbiE